MTTALVVEDDPHMMEAITDTLFTLGHDHVWATNLQDARELIQRRDFDYGMFDLQIPAMPGRAFAKTEHGIGALEEFQQKFAGRVPALVMTGHHEFCMNNSVPLRAKGAVDFIAKPFPLEGRTLGHVIRSILPAPVVASPISGTQFQGGPLAFHRTTVDLLGVPIISNRGGGQAMALLRTLTNCDQAGRFVHRSAEDLVQSLGPHANIGTVTSCVRLVRTNASSRLKKLLGLDVGPHDVIGHEQQGYFLQDWITVQLADQASSNVPSTPLAESNVPAEFDNNVVDGLNPRQRWVLKELQRGAQVERTMLELRFGVSDKTAKRDLAGLTSMGLIEFVRAGNGGHYRSPEKRKLNSFRR